MYKTQIFGDIHGRDNWKRLLDMSCDKIVFTGDYCDSGKSVLDSITNTWRIVQDKTDNQILNNLADIIQFKRDNMDKVVLLGGNHDWCYFKSNVIPSGYRKSMRIVLYELFHNNRELFEIAYQRHNLLITHAGITNKWFNKYSEELDACSGDSFAETLNNMWNSRYGTAIEEVPYIRGGTKFDNGGPLWADKTETQVDPLSGWVQVVGHTGVDDIEHYIIDPDTEIYFIDCISKDKSLIL